MPSLLIPVSHMEIIWRQAPCALPPCDTRCMGPNRFRRYLDLCRIVQQAGLDWDQAEMTESAAILVHHQALLRNKRCMLSYL